LNFASQRCWPTPCHRRDDLLPLADLVIFHNALDIMDVVRQLVAEGWTITAAELGALSPYLRGHISRFGAYATDELGRRPGAFNPVLKEVDFTTPGLAA
jgi:Tn3 transposase DDE domain